MRLCLYCVAACLFVSGCAAGPQVYGHVRDVTRSDIDAAIAADNSTLHDFNGRIFEVEVINRNEIHIFHHRRIEYEGYCVIMRKAGKWQFIKIQPVAS
jgi:hypothetical protein